jgi:hypothetical protein
MHDSRTTNADAQWWASERVHLLDFVVGVGHKASIASELLWRKEALRYSKLPSRPTRLTREHAVLMLDFNRRIRAAWENEHLRFELVGDQLGRPWVRFRDEDEIWYLLKYT